MVDVEEHEDESDHLQLLLSQLSERIHQSSVNTTTRPIQETVDTILKYLLGDECGDADITTCIAITLTADGDDDNIRCRDHHEVLAKIRQLLSISSSSRDKKLSPFDAHLVASQALAWSSDDQGDDEDDQSNDNDNNNNNNNNMKKSTIVYRSVCFGIMCWMLHQRQQSDNNKRTKRWYSCTCETVRHFQRYFVVPGLLTQNCGRDDDDVDMAVDTNNDNNKQNNTDIENIECAVSLWVNYIVPSCIHVSIEDPKQQGAILCGIVSTTIKLAEMTFQQRLQKNYRIQESDNDSSSSSQKTKTTTSISNVLARLIFQISTSTDLMWLHPWRLDFHQKSNKTMTKRDGSAFFQSSQTFEDSVTFWSLLDLEHFDDDKDGDRSDDDEDDYDYDPRDFVVSMDTLWDPDGLALLSVAAFQYRPKIWSKTYVWKCWFPHIPAVGHSDHKTAGRFLKELINQTPAGTLTRSAQPLEAWINVSQSLSKDPVTLRKLFHCFKCVDQVWLLQQLYNRSQDVFKPRWIDCMRDVVEWTDVIAIEQIWRWFLVDVLGDKESSVEVRMSIVGLVRRWVLEKQETPPISNVREHIQASKKRYEESGNFDLLTLAFEQLEDSLSSIQDK
mmetsp:Transcript_18217/g.44023  ORF Transcript_18217/g.44023 Transcript_18217/m.44023 type:complete len:615 (-) Transcript_18217:46-1890(-)